MRSNIGIDFSQFQSSKTKTNMLQPQNPQGMRKISSYSYESNGSESTISGISPFNYGSNGSSFSFDGFDKLPDDLESVFLDNNSNEKSQTKLSAKGKETYKTHCTKLKLSINKDFFSECHQMLWKLRIRSH